MRDARPYWQAMPRGTQVSRCRRGSNPVIASSPRDKSEFRKNRPAHSLRHFPLIQINGETCRAMSRCDDRLLGENDMTKRVRLLGLIVTAALFTAAPMSLQYAPSKVLSVSLNSAEARVGRPLTPMSVAGVNRRVHRRAYYGAAAGAAAYGAYGTRRACGYYPYPPCY